MKILDKRVLEINGYEYPQIMVNNDWIFCDGRPCFEIKKKKDSEEYENKAQEFLDNKELKPENIKYNCIHAIEECTSDGGTLYKISTDVYLTLSQIDSMNDLEFAKAFVPSETLQYIKNNLIIRD